MELVLGEEMKELSSGQLLGEDFPCQLVEVHSIGQEDCSRCSPSLLEDESASLACFLLRKCFGRKKEEKKTCVTFMNIIYYEAALTKRHPSILVHILSHRLGVGVTLLRLALANLRLGLGVCVRRSTKRRNPHAI